MGRGLAALSALCMAALVLSVAGTADGKRQPLVKGWTGTITHDQHESTQGDGISESIDVHVRWTIIGHSPIYTGPEYGSHGAYWTKAAGSVKDVTTNHVDACGARTVTTEWQGTFTISGVKNKGGVWIGGVRTSPRFFTLQDPNPPLRFKQTVTGCAGNSETSFDGTIITPHPSIQARTAIGSITVDNWRSLPGGPLGEQNGDGRYTWRLKWCPAPATSKGCSK